MSGAARPALVYSWQRGVPRVASLRRRAVAFLLDLLIIFVLTYVLAFSLVASGVLQVPAISLDGGPGNEGLGFVWLVSLLELPLNLAYFTLLEGLQGRTVGKLIAGLAVECVGGGQPSMMDAFLRGLLRCLWVTPFALAFIVIDLYVIHASEIDQRIGDYVSKTVVVRDSG
ncbi:MAG: RDD family protein [Thermoplasmatota archaeon]